MRRLFLAIFIFPVIFSNAQELNCSVNILSPTISGTTDKKVFETLQQAIFEFMNNRKWTKEQYQNEERIECLFTINIAEKISTDEYRASIQVQSRRLIFKTSYNSLVFNYDDKDFQFRYLEFQPLEFSETSHLSNLTSVLAFYAYMVIGADYDSYSIEGGTPYYQKAQQIVTNAQTGAEKGWKAFENTKNRYWLVENTLNSTFKPIRECIYKYHRQGFDIMAQDVAGGRSSVMDGLLLLEKVHRDKPNSFNLQVFFLAKADEIVNLFSQAFPEEKTKVVNLLNQIDPANSTKYQKILSSQ